MDKKFFLISQVFHPDEVSTANLFTNLATVIKNDNYEVEVWCAQPCYSTQIRQPKHILYKGISIHYLCSTNFKKEFVIGRFINTLTFITSACIRLIISPEKTPVFTHTTQPPVGIFISLICQLKRRKLCYVLLDIFPEGLVRIGKLSSDSLIVKFWHKTFISSLKRCSSIISIGRDMKDWVEKKYPDNNGKIKYIPLWQDASLVSPSLFNENLFIKELDLKDRLVVQYSGNMGIWNDMSIMWKIVNLKPENVVFMFVGDGVRKGELIENINSDNYNAVLLPFQPAEKLGSLLTACHMALVTLGPGLEGMAVPSKIYGIMAAGVPVIAIVPDNSEIAYIVREEKCGYVLDPEDVAGVIQVIVNLQNNEPLRKEMGSNGRRAFEEKYTTQVIAKQYEEVIETLLL
jgi:glycosyltransferase involved in cell wall biosynthesis